MSRYRRQIFLLITIQQYGQGRLEGLKGRENKTIYVLVQDNIILISIN